jgi:NADH:ubiquinone oxidoreductase subunit 4 (subunit M)
MSPREFFTLAPLAALTLVFGIFPMPILNLMSKSVGALVEHMKNVGGVPWL